MAKFLDWQNIYIFYLERKITTSILSEVRISDMNADAKDDETSGNKNVLRQKNNLREENASYREKARVKRIWNNRKCSSNITNGKV